MLTVAVGTEPGLAVMIGMGDSFSGVSGLAAVAWARATERGLGGVKRGKRNRDGNLRSFRGNSGFRREVRAVYYHDRSGSGWPARVR